MEIREKFRCISQRYDQISFQTRNFTITIRFLSRRMYISDIK